MQEHVRGTEQGRQGGDGVCGILERLLAEDVQVALEGDDRIGVGARRGKGCVPAAANQLVDAVESHERGALHQASVGRRHEAPEGGGRAEGSHVHTNEARHTGNPAQCGYPHTCAAGERTPQV